jgi:type I restriction enzyme S subunit
MTKLPTGWVEVKLSEVVTHSRSKILPTPKSKLPFIGLEHIEANSLVLSGTGDFSEMRSAAVHCHSGDVIYGRLRPYLNKVTQIDFEAAASAEFIVFPPNELIEGGFLKYLLHSRDFVFHAAHEVSGDRPRIDSEQVGRFTFLLPPKREQARIVAAIDELFTRLEESAALLELAEERCNGFGRSFAQAAYSGQLTSHSIGKTPVVLQAETRDDAWVAPFSFPDTWQISTLGELAEVVGGVTKDSKKKFDDPIQSPYLRVANVQRGHLALEEVKTITTSKETLDRLRLREGDILLNEGGDLDKLGRGWVWEGQIEDCIHQNHVFRARLKNNILPPKFISRYINEFCQGFFIKEGNQTTNLASVSMTKVRKVPIPVPTKKEAEKIDALCDQNQSNIDQTLQTIVSQRQNLESLRQSILAAAFRGELVPQDPKDEPASVLLDRIRIQHAATVVASKARKTVPPASAKRKRV